MNYNEYDKPQMQVIALAADMVRTSGGTYTPNTPDTDVTTS